MTDTWDWLGNTADYSNEDDAGQVIQGEDGQDYVLGANKEDKLAPSLRLAFNMLVQGGLGPAEAYAKVTSPEFVQQIAPVVAQPEPGPVPVPIPTQHETPQAIRANFMHGPALAAAAAQLVRTAGGHSFQANPESAPYLKGFVEELEKLGAPIRGIGGYNVRNIAGTNRLSQHAYGNAIDIDQHSRNVVDEAFARWAAANRGRIAEAARRWGIVNGGDWRNPDFGHFEWGGARREGLPVVQAAYRAPEARVVPVQTLKAARYPAFALRTGIVPGLDDEMARGDEPPPEWPGAGAPTGIEQRFVNRPYDGPAGFARGTMIAGLADTLDRLKQEAAGAEAGAEAVQAPVPTPQVPTPQLNVPVPTPQSEPQQKVAQLAPSAPALPASIPEGTFAPPQPMEVQPPPASPAPPISQSNFDVGSVAPEQVQGVLQDAPPPEGGFLGLMDKIWNAPQPNVPTLSNQLGRFGRQAAKSALIASTAVPPLLLGGMQAMSEGDAGGMRSPEDQARIKGITDWLLRHGVEAYKASEWATGAGEPHGLVENAGEAFGSAITPSMVMSSGLFGADLLGKLWKWAQPGGPSLGGYGALLNSSVNATEGGDATPPVVQQLPPNPPPDVPKPVDDNTSIVRGADGSPVVIGGVQEDAYMREYMRFLEAYNKPFLDAARVKDATPMTPPAEGTRTVMTLAGPMEMRESDLTMLGAMGILTLGMGLAPNVIRGVSHTRFFAPVVRDVLHAPAGLESIANMQTYRKTVTGDVWSGLDRDLRRYGAPQDVRDRLAVLSQTHSGAAAQAHVDNALQQGRIELPGFRFNAPALADMSRRYSDPIYGRYLDLLDTNEAMNEAFWKLSPARQQAQIAAGPMRMRGMDQHQVLTEIQNIEQMRPDVKDFVKEVEALWRQVRHFETTGEYATLSAADRKKQNADRPHFFPGSEGRVTDESRVLERSNWVEEFQREISRRLRRRMENEVKGQYINEFQTYAPESHLDVLSSERRANPDWADNGTMTSYFRRGRRQHIATDPLYASIYNIDPHMLTGQMTMIANTMKRGVEATTTGLGAPPFALTSGLRNWFISGMTEAAEMPLTKRSLLQPAVHFGSSVYALPQQLLPPLADWIGRHALAPLADVLNNQQLRAMSQTLSRAYERSFIGQMERAGKNVGSSAFIRDPTTQRNAFVQKIVQHQDGWVREFGHGYMRLIDAIHNAPGFGYAYRTRAGKHPSQSVRDMLDITGNARISGRYWERAGKPIALPQRAQGTRYGKANQNLGRFMEAMRQSSPWFNVTMQGMRRVAKAYMDNPLQFIMAVNFYTALPALIGYLWNRYAGYDPQGQSYIDYQMNRRHDYGQTMWQYIAVPGRPAAEGIELPIRMHEVAFIARMLEAALHHWLGGQMPDGTPEFGSVTHTTKEDLRKILLNWADIAAPALPPAVTVPIAGVTNQVVGSGPFGGFQTYELRADPYDTDLPSNSKSIEAMARALAPGLADWAGQAVAAMFHDPGTVQEKILHGLQQGGRRLTEKTALLRDVAGIKPPASGSNDVTETLFKKNKAINTLARFMRDIDHMATDNPKYQGPYGWMNIKPGSKSGEEHVQGVMGDLFPAGTDATGQVHPGFTPFPGKPVALPTNPLYNEFIREVQQKFTRDATEKGRSGAKVPTGGIGYRSIWKRYSEVKKAIQSLRNVDAGNERFWKERVLEANPDALEIAARKGVNVNDPRAVRNYLEQVRQDYVKQILFTIRAVEQDMSRKAGRPVRIEDLSPWAGGESPDTWGVNAGIKMQEIVPDAAPDDLSGGD